MPSLTTLRRLNMLLTFPDLFLLLLLILPNCLWKCCAGELILGKNLDFDHDAIHQQEFNHAGQLSRIRRSATTSNQSEEDELCPECVIKREVLDHLPPSIYPPRDKSGGPMRLSTKIVVKELMDMSVKTETLTVMAWIRMYWHNLDIRWDVKRLKVKEIRVNPSQVWVPDMVISNSLSSFEIMGSSTLPLIVGFTGFTYYSVPVIIKTKCQATVTYFPFDEQLCEINFLSWTYHSKMVNLTLSSFTTNLEGHIGNIEWTITNITSQIVYEHDVSNHPLYLGEVIRYPYIKYRIHLSRKPDFYVNSLITPSLLLSWLGSIIFLLPSDCGEKLGFSVTLFLALYVNQVVVSDFLPPSADSFPLLARLYTTITLLMGLSIILTVLSLTVHFRVEPRVMPLKGSLLDSIFTALEHLGSCSLLTIINHVMSLCRRNNGTSYKPSSPSTNSTSIPSRFGIIRDSNLMRNGSRVSSMRNGYNNYNIKPVDFVYNSACAQPIPNSASHMESGISEEDPIDLMTLQKEPQRQEEVMGSGSNESEWRVNGEVPARTESNFVQADWPKDIVVTLDQIKNNLSVMTKYWSAREEQNGKSGSGPRARRGVCSASGGDLDKRRWVLNGHSILFHIHCDCHSCYSILRMAFCKQQLVNKTLKNF